MSSLLYLVWIIALISPGPDVILVLKYAMAHSRKEAMAISLGIVVGNAIWIILTILGLKALMDTHPSLLNYVQLAGGLFLAYIGMQSITSVNSFDTKSAKNSRQKSLFKSFVLGLGTNILNPKALIFFSAIFVQFGNANITSIEWVVAFFILIFLASLWFFTLSFIASSKIVIKAISKWERVVNIVAGVIFLILGVVMLVNAILHFLK